MKTAALLLVCAALAWPQVATEANKNYTTKEGRDGVARTLDNPNRDKTQKPEEIIELMHIRPGMTVADIGTGTGYMLPFLSKAVEGGKVIGEDIAPDFLDRARARVSSDKLTNADLILGTETDPKLPAHAVDIALVLDVYHHFNYPAKMLANIAHGLKPHAHLVIVDFYKKDMPNHVRLDRDEVAREVESNGFRLIATTEHTGNKQYMLTFEKR